MARRRKTLLIAFALVFLAVGGLTWYWQATAVDRQVDALLAEARTEVVGREVPVLTFRSQAKAWSLQ